MHSAAVERREPSTAYTFLQYWKPGEQIVATALPIWLYLQELGSVKDGPTIAFAAIQMAHELKCSCGNIFRNISDARTHHVQWSALHAVEPLICPWNGCERNGQRKFSQLSNVRTHFGTHLPKNLKQFQCKASGCREGSAAEKDIKRHVERFHANDHRYILNAYSQMAGDTPMPSFEPNLNRTNTIYNVQQSHMPDHQHAEATMQTTEVNETFHTASHLNAVEHDHSTPSHVDFGQQDHVSPVPFQSVTVSNALPQTELERMFDQHQRWQPGSDSQHAVSQAVSQPAVDSTAAVVAPQQDPTESLEFKKLQGMILKSLRFKEMGTRFMGIKSTAHETGDWILADPVECLDSKGRIISLRNTFSGWLKDCAPSDRIFYISGKAGCGKSTLLKHIVKHAKLDGMLDQWLVGLQFDRVVKATFCFWAVGKSNEKTHEGLLRDLLTQVLRGVQNQIRTILPELWNLDKYDPNMSSTLGDMALYWDLETLRDTLRKAIEACGHARVCLCFFIDGLDECLKTDEDAIAQNLQHLAARYKYLKICTTSRPHLAFEEELTSAESPYKLAVHEYTRLDIQQFINREFEVTRCNPFAGIKHADRDSAKTQVVQEIQRMANGVFLWVVLIVKGLKQESRTSTTLEELMRVLDHFPEDLDEIYERMIDKQSRQHQKFAARLLLLLLSEYDLERERRRRTSLNWELRVSDVIFLENEIEKKHDASIPDVPRKIFEKRITDRCPHLVQIQDDDPYFVQIQGEGVQLQSRERIVQFTHKTVADFIGSQRMRKKLQDLAEIYEPLVTQFRMDFYSFRTVGHVRHLKPEYRHGENFRSDECLLLLRAYECERVAQTCLGSELWDFNKVKEDASEERQHWSRKFMREMDRYGSSTQLEPEEDFGSFSLLVLAARFGLWLFLGEELRRMAGPYRNMLERIGPWILHSVLTTQEPFGKYCLPGQDAYDYMASRMSIAKLLTDDLKIDVHMKLRPATIGMTQASGHGIPDPICPPIWKTYFNNALDQGLPVWAGVLWHLEKGPLIHGGLDDDEWSSLQAAEFLEMVRFVFETAGARSQVRTSQVRPQNWDPFSTLRPSPPIDPVYQPHMSYEPLTTLLVHLLKECDGSTSDDLQELVAFLERIGFSSRGTQEALDCRDRDGMPRPNRCGWHGDLKGGYRNLVGRRRNLNDR